MDDKIAKIIQKHYPEIANGWHCPLWGRITSINEIPQSGSLSDPYRAYYGASVHILSKDGKETDTPILSNIALSGTFSSSGGMMQLPDPGMIVTVQFAFGMPDKPYIDKVLPYGIALPGIDTNESIIQSRQGVKVHLQQDGTIASITDGAINQQSNESSTITGNETKHRQSLRTVVNEDSEHDVAGIYQLAAYGAMYLLTTGDAELSALKSLSLTAGDNLEEFIYGERVSKIEKKLQFLIKETESLSLDESGFEVKTKKGKISIGSDKVDVVKTLHSLIDIVGKLSNALATHTHVTIALPSTPPIETAVLASYGIQSTMLMEKLKTIVK